MNKLIYPTLAIVALALIAAAPNPGGGGSGGSATNALTRISTNSVLVSGAVTQMNIITLFGAASNVNGLVHFHPDTELLEWSGISTNKVLTTNHALVPLKDSANSYTAAQTFSGGVNHPTLTALAAMFLNSNKDATNDGDFTYNATDNALTLNGTLGTAGFRTTAASSTNLMYSAGVVQYGSTMSFHAQYPDTGSGLQLYNGFATSEQSVFGPTAATPVVNLGRPDARWKTNHVQVLEAGRLAVGPGQVKLLEDTDDGANYVVIQPQAMAGNVTLTLPANDGDSGQYLQTDGSGLLSWATASGTGDVFGPASVTDQTVPVFGGTSGDRLTNTPVTISPVTGAIYTPSTIHAAGAISAASLQTSNVLGSPSLLRLYETNGGFSHTIQAAAQMSRSSTNVVGVLEANTNAVVALDLRQQQIVNFTNRMTHNIAIWLSNSIPYDEYVFNFLGAASGGTDYTVTLNAMNSSLICNMAGTNNAVATNLVISVPAGSGVEVNGRITFSAGTNRHQIFHAKALH